MAERDATGGPEEFEPAAPAPAEALGMGYAALVHATAMALQNSVAQQQSMQVLCRAESSTVCAAILRTVVAMEPASGSGGGGYGYGGGYDPQFDPELGSQSEFAEGSGGDSPVSVSLLETAERPLPETAFPESELPEGESPESESPESESPETGNPESESCAAADQEAVGDEEPASDPDLEEVLAAWVYTEIESESDRGFRVT